MAWVTLKAGMVENNNLSSMDTGVPFCFSALLALNFPKEQAKCPLFLSGYAILSSGAHGLTHRWIKLDGFSLVGTWVKQILPARILPQSLRLNTCPETQK
jgi:hypothetical protein